MAVFLSICLNQLSFSLDTSRKDHSFLSLKVSTATGKLRNIAMTHTPTGAEKGRLEM